MNLHHWVKTARKRIQALDHPCSCPHSGLTPWLQLGSLPTIFFPREISYRRTCPEQCEHAEQCGIEPGVCLQQYLSCRNTSLVTTVFSRVTKPCRLCIFTTWVAGLSLSHKHILRLPDPKRGSWSREVGSKVAYDLGSSRGLRVHKLIKKYKLEVKLCA